MIADSQVLDVRDVGFVREFHILYAGDWIDGAVFFCPLRWSSLPLAIWLTRCFAVVGESGARFTFGFEDGTADAIEGTAFRRILLLADR